MSTNVQQLANFTLSAADLLRGPDPTLTLTSRSNFSSVCREAIALAERHALRGYDSVTRVTRIALRTLQPLGR